MPALQPTASYCKGFSLPQAVVLYRVRLSGSLLILLLQVPYRTPHGPRSTDPQSRTSCVFNSPAGPLALCPPQWLQAERHSLWPLNSCGCIDSRSVSPQLQYRIPSLPGVLLKPRPPRSGWRDQYPPPLRLEEGCAQPSSLHKRSLLVSCSISWKL